ncbi:hypothetical protein Efla_002127 [Eimeria flavescens]
MTGLWAETDLRRLKEEHRQALGVPHSRAREEEQNGQNSRRTEDTPEALQRLGMSDRLKIHRLEEELNEAKAVINVLTAELELRGKEQFHTPEQPPKRSAGQDSRLSDQNQVLTGDLKSALKMPLELSYEARPTP